ncbi:putative Major facilitator superfamily domain-containing protein 1 [Hypsibius exemplaris]|uniref:Lysosomal dipeptide transporter MFSD1 n=1 Tax=Hypsibius exemplaris TaxID=2072580 RepID=A0A1W0W9S6_HYPEX|nr:putative Major facilitator superfamily domain-containing protein 1 [Hypsibius exemplaris]
MHRWIFLGWSSSAFFASLVFVDQTSPLVGRLTGTAAACHDESDPDCLDFTATQFNSFYIVFYWVGGIVAMFSGFFIARYGVWLTSCLTAAFQFLGMFLFTLGPYLTSSSSAFALMLIGRLIFSIGLFCQMVLSHQIKSHWFFGKELAVAFALYNVSSRLGSIVALSAIGAIVEDVGLQRTLWITLAFGILSVIGSIVSGWIYKKHASTSIDAAVYVDSKGIGQFGFRKVLSLCREYWIITATVCFVYGPLLTTIADYPQYLSERYGYTEAAAGQITGIVPDIAICAPVFGIFIDKFGWRDIINTLSTGLLFLAVILPVAIGNLQPIVTVTLMGVAYSGIIVGLWGSIPLVVSPGDVGVAFGVALSLQSLATGLLLLVCGILLDQSDLEAAQRWEFFFILLASCGAAAWLLSGVSIFYDHKNPLRPLRMKHVVSVIKTKSNSFIHELTPLINGTDVRGTLKK